VEWGEQRETHRIFANAQTSFPAAHNVSRGNELHPQTNTGWSHASRLARHRWTNGAVAILVAKRSAVAPHLAGGGFCFKVSPRHANDQISQARKKMIDGPGVPVQAALSRASRVQISAPQRVHGPDIVAARIRGLSCQILRRDG
jgi:hypothetical protein